MPEKVNVSTEKLFFKYILENPNQFSKVLPSYFKNHDILFVYNTIREEYLNSKKKIVPNPKQIFTMLKMRSDEREISKEILKSLLSTDLTQYDEDWLIPKFKSWKLSKRIVDNVQSSIEYMRELDETNLENIQDIAEKIKRISNELDLIDDDDEDLGEDFDDPTVHRQDVTTQKISTGWPCMDTLLNGGWDYASLVTIIGETNVGKCSAYDTYIKIRNKNNGEIKNIKIGDFYKDMVNSSL
jgi:hypothetical protein